MKTIRIYTVNNKALKIIQRYNDTTLVRYIKSGIESSVNTKYIKHFDKKCKEKNINQLKLQLCGGQNQKTKV